MEVEDVIDILCGTAFGTNSIWRDGFALVMDVRE